VLEQLRARQVAEERVATYEKERIAAEGEKALREAEARALQQTQITQSELSITVKENEGKAQLKLATQQADQTRMLARAEADKVKLMGEGEAARMIAIAGADAERITRTGLATAETIARQVEASGGARYQLTRQVVERLAQALETSGVDVVPRIQISGNGTDGANPLSGLLAMLLSKKGEALLADEEKAA